MKPFGKSDGDHERRIRTMVLVLIRSLGKLEFSAIVRRVSHLVGHAPHELIASLRPRILLSAITSDGSTPQSLTALEKALHLDVQVVVVRVMDG